MSLDSNIVGVAFTPKGCKELKRILISLFVLFISVSLISASLVGCSKSTTTTSATNALQQATVEIAVTTPLTGGAASFGESQSHGVQLAFEDLNNAGGITVGNTHYTFTVKTLDDAYDPSTATNNIRTFVYQDGAKFLFTFESASQLALASTLAQEKVIQFTAVYDDTILNPANSYTFRTVIPPSMKVISYTKYLTTTFPNAKTVAHFTEDNVSGQVQTQEEDAAAKAAGLTVTDEVFYASGTTDFMALLTPVLAKNPDILSLGGSSVGSDALIVKQARAMGYKGVINNTSPCSAQDMISIAGQDALEGFISTDVAMVSPLVSQKFLDLAAREKTKFGISYGNTWDFYSQALILVAAMQRADSVDPTAIKNILEDTTQVWPYEMFVGGQATFGTGSAKTLFGNSDYMNQIINPYTISVIKNGKDTNAVAINP
jgi:branched-chain amino acid transport system substrate-binding protein